MEIAVSTTTAEEYPFKQRLVLTTALAVFGCAADLWTKSYMFGRLGLPKRDNEWWMWEPYFGFETSINQGGLFGMFQGNTHILAVISVVALVGLMFWIFFRGALRDFLQTIALGLIMGGILGNLYDRLGLWGIRGVRDWILFRYEPWTWPNFNIADMLLLAGAGCLILQSFRMEAAERKAKKALELQEST